MRAIVLLVAVMAIAASAARPGGPAVGRDRLSSYAAVSLSSRSLVPRAGSQRIATLLDLPATLTLEFDIPGGRVVLEMESATSNRKQLAHTTTGETIEMILAPYNGRVASFAGRLVNEHQFAHVSVKQIEPELVVGGYFMLNGDFYRIQPEWDEETAQWVGMTVFREADWLDLPTGEDAKTSCGATAPSLADDAAAIQQSAQAAYDRAKRADLNGRRALDIGIFADCNMMTLKGTTTAVADDVNAAIAWSNLRFSAVVNVTLEVRSGSWVFDTSCSTGFRQACSSGIVIDARLSGFSAWRAARYAAASPPSTEGLWVAITTCYQSGTVGLAWVGLVCKRDSLTSGDGKTASGTAIVSRLTGDIGFYQTFAHEVGHTFNAKHDEQTACTTGGPYIMNAVSSGPTNSIQFSSCSVATMVAELSDPSNTCIRPLGDAVVLTVSPSIIGTKTAPLLTTTVVSPAPFTANTRIGLSSDNCETVIGDTVFSAVTFTPTLAPTTPGLYSICFSDDNGVTWFAQDAQLQVVEATGASVQSIEPDVIVVGSTDLVKFTSAPITPTSFLALNSDNGCAPAQRLYTFQFDTTRDLDLSGVAAGTYTLCFTVNGWQDARQQNPLLKLHVIQATATSITSFDLPAISRSNVFRNLTTTDKIYTPTSRIAFSTDGCATTFAESAVSSSLINVVGAVATAGTYDVCFSVNSGSTYVLQTGVTMGFADPPNAPTNIAFVSSTASSVTLSYQAPANVNFGPIIDYRLEVTSPAPVLSAISPNLSGTINGLLASNQYDVTVYARNIAGESAAATALQVATAAPTVPGPPSPASGAAFEATAGTARLFWAPPIETGGIPLTGYTVVVLPPSNQAITQETQSTQLLVKGLSAATTYTVRVAAKNGQGTGTNYEFTFQTQAGSPPGKPGTPSRKDASTSSLTAKWEAPESDGGWPILSFTLYYKVDGSEEDYVAITGITELEHAIPDLSAGTAYSIKVAAVNEVGKGPDSTDVALSTNVNLITSASDWINANPAIFYGAIGGVCGIVILVVVIVCISDRKKKKKQGNQVEMKHRGQQQRAPRGANPYHA